MLTWKWTRSGGDNYKWCDRNKLGRDRKTTPNQEDNTNDISKANDGINTEKDNNKALG